MTTQMNRLSKLVSQISQNKMLPVPVQKFALTTLFNTQVKYALTSGIRIDSLTNAEAKVHLKNRLRVQNHIGGIHACGMALLAESATGMVFGMNVPDSHLPLIKSMKISYEKRCQGDLSAIASLTPEQISEIQTTDRGNTKVEVVVTDSTGNQPVTCEMIWAWTAKKKKN